MASKKVKGTKQTFVKEEIKKAKSIWVKPIECLNDRQREFQDSIRTKEVTIVTGLAGTVEFTDEDCVRNPIIPYLLSKIKEIE